VKEILRLGPGVGVKALKVVSDWVALEEDVEEKTDLL